MSDVKERPILFSGEMVRAILDGRKTMTRRVVVPQQESWFVLDINADPIRFWKPAPVSKFIVAPYQRRMKLWVRETWAVCEQLDTHSPSSFQDFDVWFKADGRFHRHEPSELPSPDGERGKWRPSIFMPRWASRITLEVVDVRVEQVKDISREDAIAEGAPDQWFDGDTMRKFVPQGWYENLWDSLNAKRGYSWASNPWVWVIAFQPCTAANQGLPTAPKGKAKPKPVAKKPAAKKTAPKGKAKTLLAKSAKKK